MLKTSVKRKQLFVDRHVQGALLVRAVLYWIACLVTVTIAVIVWRILTGPARPFYTHFDDLWFQYSPAIIATLLLLPFVIFDTMQLSNKFVGPLLRLRRSMNRLAKGEHVSPIHFRKGDFWHDLANEFNAVVARVQGETTAAKVGPTDSASLRDATPEPTAASSSSSH